MEDLTVKSSLLFEEQEAWVSHYCFSDQKAAMRLNRSEMRKILNQHLTIEHDSKAVSKTEAMLLKAGDPGRLIFDVFVDRNDELSWLVWWRWGKRS
jgi:hypothetical protein